ncbi:MAG: signal recognition particle subunit SRP54 [Paracoccaceae bacterium]
MFENLSQRLGGVFDRLTKQGALSDADVATALREVRVALLEADVSLDVAHDFVVRVQEAATGQSVTKSVTPGQQVVKIVHDQLVQVLAGDGPIEALKIDNPPTTILMVGLQGSGKTTTTGKLAKRLTEKQSKRILMASLDTNRPAAMEQLAILGRQISVDTLPIVKGESAIQIAKRAKTQAAMGGYDVVMLDTAGRNHIDAELMAEVQAVRNIAKPRETLLVVDGLTGQDAVNVASEFDSKIGITGVVLTRMDGDGRGGAALSMRAVTGKPIRFVGMGEKLDALETFEPERVAGRILGMGDIVALVEKAQETFEADQAERMMKRLQKGLFNMNDLKMQLNQMLTMGGMQGMMGMLPGMGKMQKAAEASGVDDKMLRRQIALINSMTKKERANPDLMAASRKKRVATGAGLEVSELNRLLKQHRQMADTMKKMGKGGMMKAAMKQMMGGGSAPAPAGIDPKAMAEAAKQLQGQSFGGSGVRDAGGLPGLGGGFNLPTGLSGFGFGKKK